MRGFSSLRERLATRPFVGRVAALVGGTVTAQAIAVVVSPILTRQYSPAAFGVFSIFSSLLMIVLSFASLRYEMALPLPRRHEEAEGLLGISLCAVLLATVLSAAAVAVAVAIRPGWVPRGVVEVAPYLWALPIGVLFGGLFQVLRAWAGREGHFAVIGRALTWQSAARGGLQIGAGSLFGGPTGLIVGFVSSFAFGLRPMWASAGATVGSIVRATRWSLVREYRDFPVYNASAALITTLGMGLPVIQLASYFSAETSGLFSLSMRILGLPVVVIGQSVGQVFYPAVAERDGTPAGSTDFISRTAKVLTVIGLPFFTLLALYGADVFGAVFGGSWREAGYYSQLLAPMYIAAFVASPISTFALVRQKQFAILLITIAEASSRLGAIWIGARLGSATAAVALFSAVGCAIYVGYIGWVFRLAGISLARWAWGLRGTLLRLAVAAMPFVAARWLLGGRFWLMQLALATTTLGLSAYSPVRALLSLAPVSSGSARAPGVPG